MSDEASPTDVSASASEADGSTFSAPKISLPTGGGAIRGIGEKFQSNAVTGTGKLSVPLALTPGRSGVGPQLAVAYDSGCGNGVFGIGWSLSPGAITRKTDKGLPLYRPEETAECDVFVFSGQEDLVPVLVADAQHGWRHDEFTHAGYRVKRYRPRIEGLFARIERWTRLEDGDEHWRSISRDNTLAIYGRDHASRIFDPENPHHIFSWLICESFDDKGNAVAYEYVAENADGVDVRRPSEQGRLRTANRYLKRIRYGNRRPLLLDTSVTGCRSSHLQPRDLGAADWMFEAVFDYGEGHHRLETIAEDGGAWASCEPGLRGGSGWPVRSDPFSSYRAGFEVRTYRLCQRVLMFHHFDGEAVGAGCLVRATEFEYRQKPVGSFITRITQCGYSRRSDGRYFRQTMPPLELEYTSSPLEDERYEHYEIKAVDAPSSANLAGCIDRENDWLDLYGEGICGVLHRQRDAWYYKPNAGHGHLGASELVARVPAAGAAGREQARLLDLAGDGSLELVMLDADTPGFQSRTREGGWGSFRAFSSLPVLDFSARNLRFVDLTGDGIADILITEDDAFTWHPSLLERGFGAAMRVSVPVDEEKGPHLIFDDGIQSIYLADMTGHGMRDLVRIRRHEVCYWPNLGYCRYGHKVRMEHPPWFEDEDLFEQSRVLLADTDGSGTTDIVYLGHDAIQIYLNYSGNGWSDARVLRQCPTPTRETSVSVADFLGRGTACLLWSSTLPQDSARPLRYLDLMDGRKPHLLTRVLNNLGAETRIEYASSTEFYLADKAAGKPWLTRLPFPVHVVERVETLDHVSHNRFVSSYTYHHGFFDALEREFRGFARVEKLDTEELGALSDSGVDTRWTNLEGCYSVPPVLTKTWFHTGVFLGNGRVSRHLADEYYREPVCRAAAGHDDDLPAPMLLDDTILPETETAEEAREACRALKGSLLRQETYAIDGKEESSRPYAVIESNSTIAYLQPRRDNLHAVFLTHSRETLTLNYERKLYDVAGERLADPRVTHSVVLRVDCYGNVLETAAIGYGRRFADESALLNARDREEQARTLLTYTERRYTNAVLELHAYRTPVPAETRTYELLHLKAAAARPGMTNLFRYEELKTQIAQAGDGRHDLAYEDLHAQGVHSDSPCRRLLDESRTYYRADSLERLLPLGETQALALAGQNYRLVFTRGMITETYRRGDPPETLLPQVARVLHEQGRYVELCGDGRWWSPSGRVFFAPDECTPEAELAQARSHFYLPRRFVDPFRNATVLDYDRHDIMPAAVRDALGNTVTVEVDYRVLAPFLLTDANRNRAAVAFDTLGLVVGTATMSKVGEAGGDSLDGFEPDLEQATALEHIAHPLREPERILRLATTRVVYDLWAYVRGCRAGRADPAVTYTLARETHAADLRPGERVRCQHSFIYSDGFGRQIQRKVQAEPGPIVAGGPEIDPRWVGTGWVIFNNKGKPVRQYEPFFSESQRFEFAQIIGISPILLYDPLQRLIATLYANHSYQKHLFDPWRHETWDTNDTILLDPAHDPDVSGFCAGLPESDYLPTWYQTRAHGALGGEEQAAAEATVLHAGTPNALHIDSLGRTFLTIAHNRSLREGVPTDEFSATRVELDIQGNQRCLRDALGRAIARYDYNLARTRIRLSSIDSGTRWVLNDAAGKLLLAWDSREYRLRREYDVLQRQTHLFVRHGSGAERLAERIVYGEGQPGNLQHNLRAKTFRHWDAAGVVTNARYDFKGNLLESTRQLLEDYKEDVDWSGSPALQPVSFLMATTYDALNRPTTMTSPDGSVARQRYNQAGLLESLQVNLRRAGAFSDLIRRITYNAKRQREVIEYGNGARTACTYDPLTFRLTRLETRRSSDQARLQDLNYVFDPIGNITSVRDDAQETVFFRNQAVTPSSRYAYDAIYRLTTADGRQYAGIPGSLQTTFDDSSRINQPLPSDGHAMLRYHEEYGYDSVGNILSMRHSTGSHSWSRHYGYSGGETRPCNNHLIETRIGQDAERYEYDASGNMTRMPHLPGMQWDFKDQLRATRAQVVDGARGETTYYIYDCGGQRVRKVTERASGSRLRERAYLGSFEFYREYDSVGRTMLERETLHVMDAGRRVAMFETNTRNDGAAVQQPTSLQRLQLTNHLASAMLELDGEASVISYEEYFPFGSTSFQAVDRFIRAARKRYRYTGKERDDETELYYHGARYYAPWLGRWTSSDPLGLADGVNPYAYVRNSPITGNDPSGQGKNKGNATVGDVNLHRHQGYRRPNNLESEHMDAIAIKREALRNPETGQSPIPEGRGSAIDENTPTVAVPEAVADEKTNGPGGDMEVWRRQVSESEAGALSPQTRADTATGAGLDRANAAAQRAGVPLPAGARVAQVGDVDATHADPQVQAFTHDPANNPLADATPSELEINDPDIQGLPGQFGKGVSIAVSKDPKQTSVFQGNFVEIEAPPTPSGAASPPPAAPAAPAPPPAVPTASPGRFTGAVNTAGNVAGGITRATVPLVAETEMGLLGGAYYAAGSTSTQFLVTPLVTASEAVPIVGAGVVAGGLVGNVVQSELAAHGASAVVADTGGAISAGLTGAGVGALIGAPTGIGAPVGAVVGFAAGVTGYYLSKYL